MTASRSAAASKTWTDGACSGHPDLHQARGCCHALLGAQLAISSGGWPRRVKVTLRAGGMLPAYSSRSGWPTRRWLSSKGPVVNSAEQRRSSQAAGRAGAAPEDAHRGSTGRPGRSRGAGGMDFFAEMSRTTSSDRPRRADAPAVSESAQPNLYRSSPSSSGCEIVVILQCLPGQWLLRRRRRWPPAGFLWPAVSPRWRPRGGRGLRRWRVAGW